MTNNSSRALALAALAIGLALPASASARSTFYVNPAVNTSPANPCIDPDPAKACETVMDAVEQARLAPYTGGDDINVAAGLYTTAINMNQPTDSGNVIQGAGRGVRARSSSMTTLRPQRFRSEPAPRCSRPTWSCGTCA